MNRPLQILLLLMLALSFSATTAFAEDKMGFRLTVGAVPGVEDFEFEYPVGTTTIYDLDAETGFNFNPAFVYRSHIEKPLGFVGLAGIFIRHHAGDDGPTGIEAKLTAFGINIAPGLAVRLGERAHLEFRAELGLGTAVHDVGGIGVDFDEGSGPYASFGANAGIYFNVSRVVVLGVDIGYLDFESDGDVEDAYWWETYDTEMSGSGITANASIGFMF